MRDSDPKVGRADHNPAGAEAAAEGAQEPSKVTANDAADKKGHGAHGTGRDSEKADNEPTARPDAASGWDRGGSAGWGSAASGGSAIDERPSKQ